MAARLGYSPAQITLHWLTAVLVVVAWLTSGGAEAALELAEETGVKGNPPPHVFIGLAIFACVPLRLVLRYVQGAPEPATSSPALRAAATWGHRLLYALLIVIPVLGMTTWGGGAPTGNIHGLLANLLLALALGHALVGIWHQYGRGDGTLVRMLRSGR